MVTLTMILFLIAIAVLFLSSLVWIYRDAELRGKPGMLVAILAALIAWPVSLLVWIALRPHVPPRGGRDRRPFNLADYRR